MKITTCSWLRFLAFLGMTKVILIYSAKDKLFNEKYETSIPLLEWNEYDANRWNLFDRWRFNSPMGREHARATSALKEDNDETSREVMVMYGGILYEADNTTWTYDPHFDTWEAHRSASPQPQATVYHTLVTLCQRRVLLFGGCAYSGSSQCQCRNETWSFDTNLKEWRRIETKIHPRHNDDYVTPRCRHAAAVLRYDNSSCSCKDSLVIYGGFEERSNTRSSDSRENLDDLWQLVCKNQHSHVYEWRKLSSSHHVKPKLQYPSAVSAFQNTKMFLLGQTEQNRSGHYWEVWSYDVVDEVWSKVGNTSKQSSVPGQGVYVTDDIQSYHFLISCCSEPLTAFDVMTRKWFTPTILSNRKGPDSLSGAVTRINKNVLVSGGSPWFLGYNYNSNIMWELSITSARAWYWLAKPAAAITRNPLAGISWTVSGMVLRQKLVLVFGESPFLNNKQPTSLNLLHILDLKSLSWSPDTSEKRPPFKYGAVSAILDDSVFVVYGGVLPEQLQNLTKFLSISHDVWCYYSEVRSWVKYSIKRRRPSPRMLCSRATTNNQMIVYGGLTASIENILDGSITTFLRDLWSFTLPKQNAVIRNLSKDEHNSEWRLLDDSGPLQSAGTSLVAIENTLILYGGARANESTVQISFQVELQIPFTLFANCTSDVWEYDLTNGSGWKQVKYSGSGPGRRCLHESLRYGNHMLVFGGCHNHVIWQWNTEVKLGCPVDPITSGMWIYDPSKTFWLRLSQYPFVEQNGLFVSSLIWKNWILAFGGVRPWAIQDGMIPRNSVGLSVYRPNCPAGFTSSDLRKYMCSECPFGSYSPATNSTCLPCPPGLTTSHKAATDKTDCNRCLSNHCVHGSCTVTLQGPAFDCVCQFGFTKDGNGVCTVATYYIAAAGSVAGVALIVLLVVLAVKARRARKRHNMMLQDKDRELVEMTNSFNIDSREVRLRARIDKNAPGGFGEVYKAEYREMTVAVKKLQGIHQHLDRIALEFEREIEVMRTIRHPNIVLFLGGGRCHDDGCPFLVVEYMPRGSLTTILADRDIKLEESLKMRFAVDAAKGMRFLHSQRPPRIHRDLKSANLLVSTKWVVKVADFGAARLVRDEGISQEAVRGAGPLDMTAPLLRADYHLSSGVGTPKWSAPEILSGHSYGTPADVYR